MARLIISLTEKEKNRAREIAETRLAHKKSEKKVDNKRDPLSLNMIGIASEMALAKHLGIPYNPPLLTGGDEYDLNYRGYKLEVKCIWFLQKEFLCVKKDHLDKPSDVLVSMKHLHDFESFEVLGWIPKSRFMVEKELITWPGYDKFPMYCMPRRSLEKPEFLQSI
jgi:hypothetical protein